MMYYTTDGSIAIDDRPAPRNLFSNDKHITPDNKRYEELLELVEAIEAAAATELAAYGCIEFEHEIPEIEFISDEFCDAAYAAYCDDNEPVSYELM